MSPKGKRKRKSPVLHTVRPHTRKDGATVRGHPRGKGTAVRVRASKVVRHYPKNYKPAPDFTLVEVDPSHIDDYTIFPALVFFDNVEAYGAELSSGRGMRGSLNTIVKLEKEGQMYDTYVGREYAKRPGSLYHPDHSGERDFVVVNKANEYVYESRHGLVGLLEKQSKKPGARRGRISTR